MRLLPFAASQDHKRAYEGDTGPNTGGMGAYCDGRILTERQTGEIMERVMLPAVRQMAREGVPFTGFLYAGLMMTAEGPKVLEFNARLGDPETQALMASLDGDLGEVLMEAAEGELRERTLTFGPPAVCVVLAAAGYPERPVTGQAITGTEQVGEGAQVFHAGTAKRDGRLVTSGGRVLGVTATGATLPEAVERVYRASGKIYFEGMHYRRDIARKGFARW